jgi:hypothetical protein
MKKGVIIIIGVFTIFTLSCSNGDNNNTNSNLIGKWDLIARNEANGTSIPLTNCDELYNSEEFFDNNTSIGIWAEPGATGNNCGVQTFQKTYTLINNVLSLKKIGFYEFRYNVIELTSNKLTLKLIYREEDGLGSGYNIPTNEQTTDTFEKVN